MIPPLTRFGVNKPVPARLFMWTLIIAGIYCALTMRREFFPETNPDRARIVLPYPGATPLEIEESMARKVEDAVADLEEVDEIETSLGEGLGVVIVKFNEGENLHEALNEVRTAVDSLTDLPTEAERIVVQELRPQIPVIMLTLYGQASELALKEAMQEIVDDLRALPGMGTLVVSGTRRYELRVEVSETALLEHGLSLPQVTDRIRAWMNDIPGGALRTTTGNINVRTLGVAERAEAIREIVLAATPEGQSLRVGDVALVRDHFVDDQIERRFNGLPAVSVTAFKTGDEDAIEIAQMVRSYAAGIEGKPFPETTLDRILHPSVHKAWEAGHARSGSLPASVALHSDLARLIEGRLSLLTGNAIQGAILIFIALLLFLSPRPAWWVMVGLFTALGGTLVMMTAIGVTLNMLTMFGMLIVLGMLQDDAIVVSENIISHHDAGTPPKQAAIKGAEEVFWPVIGTVTTTIVAFMPLMLVKGPIGELLQSLPLVVMCALVVSFVECMMTMPSHLAHSLEVLDRRTPGPLARAVESFCRWRDRAIIGRAIEAYARLTSVMLEYRYITVATAFATLLISLGMVAGGRLPFTFLPKNDAETVVVDLRMPVGTPLPVTEALVREIEAAALAQPETRSVSAIVGEAADIETAIADAPATHVGQLFIELVPVEERDRVSTAVTASIREAIPSLDTAESIRFTEVSGGPGGRDITVEVRGEDRAAALLAVERVKAILAEYEGVRDISDDDYESQREIQVALRPGAAAMGLTVADVARQVRGVLFGLEAHTFSERREDIDVRVRLEEESRRRIETIESMWIVTPDGRRAPIGEVAELIDGTSFATLRRVDRERTITVSADCAFGTNPEQVNEAITPRLQALQREFPGLRIETAGRAEDVREAFSSLPMAIGAAMLLIYVILAWLFSSYVEPLAVMVAIPFAVIGVVWGHLAMGYQLDFLSVIGIVALSGVVVNNSLVFVDFANRARDAGRPLKEALVAAGRQRLRPIVLTSLTTFLGLTPLMAEQSFQARFLIPMAISIAFGLLSSTVLTLVVLPAFLVVLDDIKAAAHFLWFGRTRADRAAEAAARPAPVYSSTTEVV